MTRRIGLGIIGLTVCAAVFGPWLVPHDPDVQSLAQRLAGPSWTHPLGLDELGRDILARLVDRSLFWEILPDRGREMIVGVGRVGGRVAVGVVGRVGVE